MAVVRLSYRRLALCAFLFVSTLAVDLPFGDVNVLVLTDTHSWVAGHAYHEGDSLNADYGDILSFYERLKADCNEHDRDLWFVNNGDIVHGTGLSTNPPVNLTPILLDMPFDAINVGNHELEQDETVQYMMGGYIHSWGQAYLTSNVVNHHTHQPLGRRYRLLKGNHSTIMAFGFLYDMSDASRLVRVEPVEHIATTNWFVTALRGHRFDAVLVLAHMDLTDPLVDILRVAIRGECGPHMPIQFITGHTHYRGFSLLDPGSSSFEAGRYLDTVGFVSFPTKHTVGTSTSSFQPVFLDANKAALESALPNGPPLETDAGISLSQKIHNVQISMGLLDVVGCSPRRYYETQALHEKDSLWGLYLDQVVPFTLWKGSDSNSNSNLAVFMQSVAWTFRYDMLEGNVTVTDIAAVVAVDETILKVASNVTGYDVNRVVQEGAHRLVYLNGSLPSFASTMVGGVDDVHDVYTVESDLAFVLGTLFPNQTQMNETFEGVRTVRSIWTEYVSNYLKCHAKKGKKKRRKPPGSSSSTTEESNTTNERSRRDSIKWGILLAIFAAIFAAILLTFVYFRSRRRPKAVVASPDEYNSILIV